jgi:hypothetical protein
MGVTAMVCAPVVLSACYTYSNVDITDVAVGNDVRVRVTAEEADRAETMLGYRSTTLEGQLVERRSNGRFLLRVPGKAFSVNGQARRYYQRVALAPADVLDLQARKLNVRRTGALLAVGVAAVVFILKSELSGQTGGSPGGTGGSPRAILVPIH